MTKERSLETLAGLLADLQEKYDALEFERDELAEKLEWDSDWRAITTIEPDNHNLPVPRLELRAHVREGTNRYKWCYNLIYKHLCDHLVCMPMGVTDVGSATGPVVSADCLNEPFRDSAHIRSEMDHMNLRGFVIYNDHVMEINSKNRDQRRWNPSDTESEAALIND